MTDISRGRCIVTVVGMLAVIAAYVSYLCLTPNPQDGVLFGSVMAVIGLLAGVNVKEFLPRKGGE